MARSKGVRLTKVGSAKSAVERVRHLNVYQYGGGSDWQIEFYEATATAGRIEFAAHQLLSKHSASGTYFKGGRDIECQEIFSCSVTVAVNAVRQALATTATPCL